MVNIPPQDVDKIEAEKNKKIKSDLLKALLAKEFQNYYDDRFSDTKISVDKKTVYQDFLRDFSNKQVISNNTATLEALDWLLKSNLKFEDIAKYTFSINDLSERADKYHALLKWPKSEKAIINDVLPKLCDLLDKDITTHLQSLTPPFVFSLATDLWDEFINFSKINWLKSTGVAPSVSPNWTIKSVKDLHNRFKSFLSGYKPQPIVFSSLPNNIQDSINILLKPIDYDPTEKAVIKASIGQIKASIKNDFKRKPTDLDTIIKDYETRFLKWDNRLLNIESSLGDLRSWKNELASFMIDHNFSDEEKDIVHNTTVSNESILFAAQEIWNFSWDELTNIKSGDLSKRSDAHKIMFNKIWSQQMINKLQEGNDLLDKQINDLWQLLTFPGSVNKFLKDYNKVSDDELRKLVPNQFSRHEWVVREYKTLSNAYWSQTPPRDAHADLFLQLEKHKKLKNKSDIEMRMAYIAEDLTKGVSSDKVDEFKVVMDKLLQNNFDFSKLTLTEKNAVLAVMLEKHLDEIQIHNTVKLLGVDSDAYIQFIHDIFDLTKSSATMQTSEWPLQLNFKKKDILWSPLDPKVSFSEIFSSDSFPIHLELDVSDTELESVFQELMWTSDNNLTMFHKFNGHPESTKVAESYKVNLHHKSWSPTYEDVYMSPYGSDGYEATTEEWMNDHLGSFYLYKNDPVTVPSSKREYVLDANWQPVIITQSAQKSYEVHIAPQDKVLHFNGWNISRLLMVFALLDHKRDPNWATNAVKAQLDKFEKWYVDLNKHSEHSLDEDWNPLNPSPEEQKIEQLLRTDEDKFLDIFNSRIEPRNNEDFKLEKWLRLFSKDFDVKSPSLPAWWFLRREFECIWFWQKKWVKTVKFKVYGAEYRLGSQEWRTLELPMNEAVINYFIDVFGPSLHKVLPKWQDFKKSLASFDLANTWLDLWEFGTLDLSWSFFKQWIEKIEYFGVESEAIAKTKDTQPILYRVEHQNGRFQVTSTYLQGAVDKDWNSSIDKKSWKPEVEKEVFKQNMSYEAFMIFMAEKKLSPKTNLEAKILEDQKNQVSRKLEGPSRWTTRVSFMSAWGFLKDSFGKVTAQIKSMQDNQLEELTEYMIEDRDFFGLFWSFIPSSIINFAELKYSYSSELADKTYSKITKQWDRWKWRHHSEILWSYDNPAPWWIVEVLKASHLSNWMLTYKERMRAAAGLMYVLDKKIWPYGRWMASFPVWSWVKAILWPTVHDEFMLKYKAELLKIKSDWNEDVDLDKLNRLEMKFLFDNIRWWHYDLNLEWVYNPRRLYSRSLANDIDSKSREYYRDSKWREDSFNGLKDEAYEFIEWELRWMLLGNRVPDAIWALRALAKNTKTEEAYKKLYKYYAFMMMSWMITFETFNDSRYHLQEVARSSGILIGTWCPDHKQQKKLFTVLNMITNWKFAETCEKPSIQTMYSADRSPSMPDFFKWFEKAWDFQWNETKIVDFLTNKNPQKDSWWLPQDLISLAWSVDTYNGKLINSFEKKCLEELKWALYESWTSSSIDAELRNATLITYNPFTTSPSIFSEYSGIKKDGLTFDRQQWKTDTWHQYVANQLWSSVKNWVPKHKFNKELESDKLAFYIKRFFAMFQRFFSWNEAQFTRILWSLSKNVNNPAEQRRIIHFYLRWWMRTNSAASNGVPKILEEALESYVEFFANNLSNLDQGIMVDAMWEEDGWQFNNPLLYQLGYKNYTRSIKEKTILNSSTHKDEWLEYSMSQLDTKYKNKTSGESLWEKVWWNARSWWSAASDNNIYYQQPKTAPRVTQSNFSTIKTAQPEDKKIGPILKTSQEQWVVYLPQLNISLLPYEQREKLEYENTWDKLFETATWEINQEGLDRLFENFDINYELDPKKKNKWAPKWSRA